MLELIPTLLATPALHTIETDAPSPEGSELAAKQEKAVPMQTPAVAPPETSLAEFLPTALIPPAFVPPPGPGVVTADGNQNSQPGTSDSSSGPQNETRSPEAVEADPQVESAHPPAATEPTSKAPAVVAGEEVQSTARSSIDQPEGSADIPAPLPAPVATQPEPGGESDPAQTAVQPQAAAPPIAELTPTALSERKKLIEQKLAEIVAKERQNTAAKQQDNRVVAAIESAKQGKFEQARKLIQDPAIPAELQTSVLSKITTLQLAEAPRLETVKPPEIAPFPQPPTESIEVQVLDNRVTQPTQRSDRPATNPDYSGSFNAQRFDLPGPKLPSQPQFQPPVSEYGYSGSASPSSDGNYSTTSIGQAGQTQAYRTPLTGRPGNGNLRLLYPLPTPEPITSPFGWRIHPVTGQRRLHTGTDIGAAKGTPILAAYSGKVSSADSMGGYGLAVVIEHNEGTQDTLYAHMSEILVRPGQWVEQGMVIGRVGSTGMSTGPHLHFELRQKTSDGWQTLDPGPQLEAAKTELVRVMQSAQNPTPASGTVSKSTGTIFSGLSNRLNM